MQSFIARYARAAEELLTAKLSAIYFRAILVLLDLAARNSQPGKSLYSTVGNTINLKQLDLLPNLGRDTTSPLALQPGVTAANAAGQGGGVVAGAYSDQNTFTIDGGNNSDDMAGNTVGYIVNFHRHRPRAMGHVRTPPASQ